MAAVQYYGTGRRKTSTARVFLRPGAGAISVNHKTFEAFFPTEALRMQIRTPLVLTETADKFDILATVAGGGVSGQAGHEALLGQAERRRYPQRRAHMVRFHRVPCRLMALVRCVRSLTPYESKGCLHVQVHAPHGARVQASREIDAREAVEE